MSRDKTNTGEAYRVELDVVDGANTDMANINGVNTDRASIQGINMDEGKNDKDNTNKENTDKENINGENIDERDDKKTDKIYGINTDRVERVKKMGIEQVYLRQSQISRKQMRQIRLKRIIKIYWRQFGAKQIREFELVISMRQIQVGQTSLG